MLFRAIETAIIILTEVNDICDGRISILREIDEAHVDWHSWNQHKRDPKQELPVYTSSFLDERFYSDLQGQKTAMQKEKDGEDNLLLDLR
jgi:2,3-bisphosphoglycerate-dependent phosphoglycerate mutase